MTQAGNAYINTGSRFFTDVGAPGDNVYSTYPGSNWGSQPGTSMAAPFVTGTASLMLAANGNLRNYDLEHILKRTAQRYHLGWDSRIGYGMINAYAALQKVTAPNTVTHGNASFIRRYTNTSTSFVNGPLPGLAAGTYYSDIYELSATASYSYNGTPWAWLAVTDKGYSAANPNDASRWMQESVTSTSMSLKTFFYYIRTNSAGQTINQWAPFDPTPYQRNGSYEYTVVGTPTTTNPPAAPTNLRQVNSAGSLPRLVWNASATPDVTYQLYRAKDTNPYALLYTTPATDYTDSQITLAPPSEAESAYRYKVRAAKGGLYSSYSNEITVYAKNCTPWNCSGSASTLASGLDAAAKAALALPTDYALHASTPNPFSHSTEIRYELPEAAHVRLAVYNLLGQEVRRLVDGEVGAGFHTATFEAGDLPSGVYLYRITAGDFTQTHRMVLTK